MMKCFPAFVQKFRRQWEDILQQVQEWCIHNCFCHYHVAIVLFTRLLLHQHICYQVWVKLSSICIYIYIFRVNYAFQFFFVSRELWRELILHRHHLLLGIIRMVTNHHPLSQITIHLLLVSKYKAHISYIKERSHINLYSLIIIIKIFKKEQV